MASAKIVDRFLEREAIKFICTGTPSAKKLLRRVDESYFANPSNKAVFKRIMSTLKKTNEITSWRALTHDTALPETVRNNLTGFKQKVTINKERGNEIYKQMHIYRRRRMLDQIARHINDKQLSGNYDDEVIMQEVTDIITKARTSKNAERPLIFGKGANYKSTLDAIFSGEALPTIKTGFKVWDNVNGGIVAKSVTLLLGFTGSMKSTLAEVLASNFAEQGASVGQMSLEMGKEETLIRRSARLARIDQTEILKAKLTPKQQEKIERELAAFNKRVRRTGGHIHTHTPKDGVTEDELFLSMEIYGYHVLIIDYASLIKGMMEGRDFWQKLMAFTARAKRFANATDCRVIILAQSTKDNELKLSSNMANDADLILQIKFDQDFKTNDHIIVEVPKARKQKPFDFPLKKEGSFANICDADEGVDVKVVGRMDVKNKKNTGSKAFEDGDSVQTRGTRENKKRVIEDAELEEHFANISID